MNRDRFTDTALGLISTQSFPAIVGTADMMLKSSGVTLVGYEMIGGGYCTAVVRGGISDVRLAIEVGTDIAEQFGQKVSTIVIARPMPNLETVLPIGSKLAALAQGQQDSPFRNQAVGLLETRGFPAMVGAADAMLKSADVTLTAYHSIGAGLCTAIIRGTIANVGMAVDVGMQEAERIGELHSVMVIPRALDDLDQTLPLAKCWIEELQPLQIPIQVREVEREVIALPELKKELKPLAAPIAEPMQLPEAKTVEFVEPLAMEVEAPIAEPLSVPIDAPAEPQRLQQELPQADDDRSPSDPSSDSQSVD